MNNEIVNENLSTIATSVIQHFKWKPADVGGLFLDYKDYKGLFTYYDIAKRAK